MVNLRRSMKGGEALQMSRRAGSGSRCETAKQTRRRRPRRGKRQGGREYIHRDVRVEDVQDGHFQRGVGVRVRSAERSA